VDTFALLTVTVLAGAIRAVRLTATSGVFDEGYYVKDACLYLRGPGPCGFREELSPHPPLGKWLIALSIRLFGYRPGGWRVASLVAGTLTVAILYLLARKVLASTLGACVASGMLAIDFLHFIHSRIAMLDVFVTFFVTAAFLFTIHDRDQTLGTSARAPVPGADTLRRSSLTARPWRFAAGAMAGAAIASKWSGLPFLLAMVILVLAWEAKARRDHGAGGALRRAVVEEGPSILLALVGVPVLLYLLTHVGRVHGALLAWPWSTGSWIRAFVGRQHDLLQFQAGLDVSHPFASPAWSWPLMLRPVLYYFSSAGSEVRGILAAGNPVVWWGGMLATAPVLVRWLRRRDPAGPEGVILAGVAAAWVPWLILSGVRRLMFLFYFLPAVPFLCLALGCAAVGLRGRWLRRGFIGLLVAAVALFALAYPILTARPVARESWSGRILTGAEARFRRAADGSTRPERRPARPLGR
jgi:dolichyl-phosphate-mannose-protein mannosyltransferase